MSVVGVVVRLLSRPIVDGLLIAVGHTVVALLKLPMRPRRVCLRGVIMIVSGDFFKVALTDIDSTSCETFTYRTMHTSVEQRLVNTNRKSTTRFLMSPR